MAAALISVKRHVKKTKKSASNAGDRFGEHLKRHIFSRWRNLVGVKRFVVTWLLLLSLMASGLLVQNSNLSAAYLTDVPEDGGVYIEGVVGEVNNLSPIFASTSADNSVSRLIFNGLFRYDEDNKLVPDLASDYTVDEEGLEYVVNLKKNIFWHDGRTFMADDVVYTIEAIQHPDSRSPLNSSWRNVNVQKVGDHQVKFTLSNSFTPFIHSLTVGILPSHILKDVDPIELRAHPFNLQPIVGTGPFKFDQLIIEDKVNQIELDPNAGYHMGKPKLDKFIVRSFENHEEMILAFNEEEITSMSGLRTFDSKLIENVDKVSYYDLPLFNEVFVFLKNSDPLLKSNVMRNALTRATDRQAIFEMLNGRFAIGQGPLLPYHEGYDPKLVQARFDQVAAGKLLDKAGWILDPEDNLRYKDGKPLEINLVSQSNGEFPLVVQELQNQWARVGIKLNAQLVTPEELQQNHVIPHNYQVLLANVSLGVDPDVFVYWHSSQAAVGGFNFSEYKNPTADIALGAGRTRSDGELRAQKYKAFLEEWVAEAPAVGLYQPAFGYVQRKQVRGFTNGRIVSPDDRFKTVHLWTVNTQSAPRQK